MLEQEDIITQTPADAEAPTGETTPAADAEVPAGESAEANRPLFESAETIGVQELQAQLIGAKMQSRRNLFWGLIIGMLLAVLVTCGVYGVKVLRQNAADKAAAERIASEGYSSIINGRSSQKLAAIEAVIEENYSLNPDITEEEMEEGLYSGLMESLDDIYSEYYTAEEYQALMESNEGIYYGIGAYVSLDKTTEMPYIVSTIAGSPAEDSEIRPGDIIYEVDGVSTAGLSLTDVTGMIKGEEGTEVTLTLIRNGEEFDVTLKRAKVSAPSVTEELLENDIAYIRISEFNEATVDQFTDAYAMAKGQNAVGLIIDLRGNLGGLLSSVVDIAGQILPKGLIVYTEDKNGVREEYTCDGAHQIEIPVVVLVDENTASAAEILTGAIKDHGIGTIVGKTTYGKGIVQRIFPLSDGSAIKLTISAYYTPSGVNIHGTGIEPDIEVDFDADRYLESEGEDDTQLNAAIEEMEKLIAQ